MDVIDYLLFASDAERLAVAGVVSWLCAAICLAMEWLRGKKRSVERLERVGFMPWTSLFVGFATIGGGCLAMSLPIVLGKFVN